MHTIIAHPATNEQSEALEAVMKALKIEFEVERRSHYNTAFVQKVNESRKQASEGKTTRIGRKDIQDLLSLT